MFIPSNLRELQDKTEGVYGRVGNKRKIIYSVLKEIEKGENEPKAEDYEISTAEFGDIVDMMEGELIKGSAISRGGQGNRPLVVFLKGATVTLKGLQYLEENNMWAKTYRGLKEIKDWLRL